MTMTTGKDDRKHEDIRVKVVSGLVCPRRSMDHKKLESYFLKNNCRIVEKLEDATHIVAITCAFLDRAIQESIDLINTLKQYEAKLIVGGCLYDIAGDRLREVFKGDIITTKGINRIDDLFPGFEYGFQSIPDANTVHDYWEIDSIIGARRSFVQKLYPREAEFNFWVDIPLIRIGYGCNFKCSYCSHRNAIGKYRSKPLVDCLNEFTHLHENGFRTFRITSMDTGSYGVDLNMNMPDLFECFLEIAEDVQFVLEDINPVWMNRFRKEILDLVKRNKIIGIQTPCQSGSPVILKKMRRWNNREGFVEILNSIKTAKPDLHLSTELLFGFPSETEEDFCKTLDFLTEGKMDFTYIYPYYENEFIESNQYFPKCDRATIDRRVERAIEFCDRNSIGYCVMKSV